MPSPTPSPALHHTLAGVAIPRCLVWSDEFSWTAPVRAVERSITGAVIMDVGVRQAGRPVTLSGEVDHGWIRRAALEPLWALVNADTGSVMTLALADGREMQVRFADGDALQVQPIARAELPNGALPYVVTVRLITNN